MFESRTATHMPNGGRARLHHGPAVVAYAHDLPGNIVQSKKPLPCLAAQDASASTAMVLLRMHRSR